MTNNLIFGGFPVHYKSIGRDFSAYTTVLQIPPLSLHGKIKNKVQKDQNNEKCPQIFHITTLHNTAFDGK